MKLVTITRMENTQCAQERPTKNTVQAKHMFLLGKLLGQFSFAPQIAACVDIQLVLHGEEIIHQRGGAEQALQRGRHETGVSQVIQA